MDFSEVSGVRVLGWIVGCTLIALAAAAIALVRRRPRDLVDLDPDTKNRVRLAQTIHRS